MNSNRSTAWIERPTFWSAIIVLLAFLFGLGLGCRLALGGLGIRAWMLGTNQSPQTTNTTLVAEGEFVGTFTPSSGDGVMVTSTSGELVTFILRPETEIFSYAGDSKPLLPGENREKIPLGLADLQVNDMLVVRYVTIDQVKQALSIQKIR